jgi:hypothetical protein
MNGKQCKKLRAIANSKAISWKETTTQGVKAWKSVDAIYADTSRTINLKDGVFFQRKLHPLSVGAIAKKMKKAFGATPRPERNWAFSAFEFMMSSHPELLGIPPK